MFTVQKKKDTQNQKETEDAWSNEKINTLITRSYFNGTIIFEYNNGYIRILCVNDSHKGIIDGDYEPEREKESFTKSESSWEEINGRLEEMINKALVTKNPVSDTIVLHEKDEESITVLINVMLIIIDKIDSKYLFYCVIENNITKYSINESQKEDLICAVEKADKANQAKSEFLSHMSHDIRTPLNAILAYSRKELQENADYDKLCLYLDKINMSGKYLLSIVNDILDISGIEQNKIVLKPEMYTREAFILTIQNVIENMKIQKNIEFTLDVSRDITECIFIDKVRFNQIVINLLSNAMKFTGSGGKVEMLIEEKVSEEGGMMKHITISDNGIGMNKDFIPHAFENFYQENRKVDGKIVQGTGLGLSIVAKLVEIMKGTICISSKINEGTTFKVSIPFDIYTEGNNEYNVVKDYSKLKHINILLAEDNDINTDIVLSLLEKYHCTTDCVVNGFEAYSKYAESEIGHYQIILMDIRMPVVDGLKATRMIRGLNRLDAKEIPIIAMTADAFHEDEQLAYEAGMSAYISKPFDPDGFYTTCCECL